MKKGYKKEIKEKKNILRIKGWWKRKWRNKASVILKILRRKVCTREEETLNCEMKWLREEMKEEIKVNGEKNIK